MFYKNNKFKWNSASISYWLILKTEALFSIYGYNISKRIAQAIKFINENKNKNLYLVTYENNFGHCLLCSNFILI